MASAQSSSETKISSSRMARIRAGNLAEPRQRARIHPAQLHPLRGRRQVPAGRRPSARRTCGRSCCRCSRRSARRASSTCRRFLPASSRTRPATSTRRTRSSSACRPTRRSSARSCRSAAGAWSRRASKSYGYKPDPKRRRDLHQVPQDAQRRRVRRLHAGHQEGPVVGHRHRPAGCLRPRPHHRRLPPGGALRRGLPDRRQGAREAGAGRPSFDRGSHPPARGAGRADPLAARN